VSIHCTDDTLLSLASGKLSAEGAFLRGLLKVKGRMAVALKVKSLLAIANDSIKKRGNQ
jgi:putative sterol carrier protein